MKKILFLIFLVFSIILTGHAQNKQKTVSKNSKQKTVQAKIKTDKMPIDSLLFILKHCKKLVVNHQTEFMHIDVPVSKQGVFFGMIMDSVALPSAEAKNLLYYNITSDEGKVTNGDIYFLPDSAYIVFTLSGRKYYNKLTTDGMNQLKGFFKLK
ncbi:MAG TPA: hypothetical protein PKO18_08335 [Chitinophagales bacterium]|nr:hypothetical protein [Chitinophagales bacterium]HNL85231.1 hypothetical protein [Chitinophagales bacterium]